MGREDINVTRRNMQKMVSRRVGRGQPEKTWNSVNEDMCRKKWKRQVPYRPHLERQGQGEEDPEIRAIPFIAQSEGYRELSATPHQLHLVFIVHWRQNITVQGASLQTHSRPIFLPDVSSANQSLFNALGSQRGLPDFIDRVKEFHWHK